MRRLLAALLLLTAAVPAAAETIVSAEISDVAVTVYRDPSRGQGAMNRFWPGGFAFITEKRTITIPAGTHTIRFEGVSEGLLPETAIVSGLPKGVREKNRDARLLSPAGLVDAYLKRQVFLRRTNRSTGKVTEQEAIIQAGPNGGVIVQTQNGVEALGCSGLPERMHFPGVPNDLSAKPTLSVIAESDKPVTATVELSYLAQGFDWSANYVARMDKAGDKLGLFAWLTIANAGSMSFANAQLQVVAGQPRKERNAPRLRQSPPQLRLRCWPMDVTSTHPRSVFSRMPWDVPMPISALNEEVVVTARKMSRADMAMAAPPPPPAAPEPAMMAQQEDLGDLKLYRVPERVTVAAKGQKQVAMINQPEMLFDRRYVANVSSGGANPRPMPFLLRSKNVKDQGLGLPLPAGSLALFEQQIGREMLVGEDRMADKAIGEDVEINLGTSNDVQWTLVQTKRTKKTSSWIATITNAKPMDVQAEVLVPGQLVNKPNGIERGRGGWKFPVMVPANGKATISYSVKAR